MVAGGDCCEDMAVLSVCQVSTQLYHTVNQMRDIKGNEGMVPLPAMKEGENVAE